jgi:hypothetical protein
MAEQQLEEILAKTIAVAVREHVDRVTKPLLDRIAELERSLDVLEARGERAREADNGRRLQ